LLGAERVFFPDAVRSTAGIHFAAVLERLGIAAALAPRLATFPNGATARRELAASPAARAIGCTQISEILRTPGVRLVGPLPSAFELATVYSAAVAPGSSRPDAAAGFVARLTGDGSRSLRQAAGFEIDPD
jgi:molybdate transport system substrate-binding protein